MTKFWPSEVGWYVWTWCPVCLEVTGWMHAGRWDALMASGKPRPCWWRSLRHTVELVPRIGDVQAAIGAVVVPRSDDPIDMWAAGNALAHEIVADIRQSERVQQATRWVLT